MAKRRTRQQKKSAHHNLTFHYSTEETGPSVKREIENTFKKIDTKFSKKEKADITARGEYAEEIRNGVVKTLFKAAFILSLELVLYLAWR